MSYRGTLLVNAFRANKLIVFISGIILAGSLFAFSLAHAQSAGPGNFNISGGLFQPNGTPIADPSVNFKIDIYDSGANCLLYSEQHLAQDLSDTKGGFSLIIGTGSSKVNNLEGNTSFSAKIFQNPGAVGAFAGCGGGVTLASGSDRLIRVSYDLGGGFIAMTPDVPITSAPYAMVAESLQGLTPANLILTNVNTQLSQNSMEYLFTNTNYASLKALVDGTSTQYLSASAGDVDLNAQKLVNVADPSSPQDAATKNYSDTSLGGQPLDMTGVSPGVGGGKVLKWDDVLNKWVAGPIGGVTSVTAGTGLAGGTILSAGTLSVDVGVTAGKILQLNGSAQVPAVDGSLLSNVNAFQLRGRNVASAAPTDGQVMTWNSSSAQWQAVTPSGGTITALTGDVTASGSGSVVATISADAITSAKINSTGIAKNLLLITDSTTGAGVGYMSCSLGQVLQWDANGWGCVDMSVALGTSGVAAGTYGSDTMVARVTVDAQGRVTGLSNVNIAFPVTSVAGRTGAVTLIASDVGGLGSAALVNVGTGSANVPQLDASGRMPAVDGYALSNVNAVKLQARAVSAAAPGVGQVLGWNVVASQWEPVSAAVGSVTGVAGGTGLVGGTITSFGTLSVDVGTTAGKIMQLTGGAQIPAVDGNLVTNVNAVKLQARDVSASAPGGGQVLAWNNTTSEWEPRSVTSGTVTTVSSGTGLVGGPISSNGTLSVDVGTGANQVVQLDGSSKLPGVDGSAVTNLNAVRIGTRTVASTAPGVGQYLGWNNLTSQWEPTATTTGTVTNVATGAGLVGGPISSTGTLSVDVGTAANKIMQLTSGAQIPAVDGNLVTNVNAVKLQARDVSASAPGGGQVLGWNSSTSVWEPLSVTSGTVMQITSGTGLTGGPISSIGTLSVDVGTTANKIVQLDGAAQLPGVDGSQLTNLNATRIGTRTIATSAPSVGQYLGWNNSTSQWEPMATTTGTVTNVATGTGLVGGPISATGTLSVDVGTAANKIMQLTAGAQIPAVDGNLVTNVNAVKLQARDVAATAPTSGQVLGWNGLNGTWEPMSTAVGSVTNIATGTGLLGGSISSSGTLSVDVGTAANKIMQLTAGAQIPAVDGNLVTNVNAVKLQARDVSSAAPGGGQVLAWNNTTSVWEPRSVTSGTVTTVSSGTGLVGGPISSNGTLSVDVGTGANQIVQLDGSSKLPGVDGSALTNLNATRIGTRTVASSAPGVGQYLGWNNLTSQWEPMATTTGTVTNVAAGTGLVGGPIANVGTLSVDVGTAANKILQLTSGAQIPAVDGNLVTNVNAVKLQARDVSAAAPGGGQVLAWNNTTSVWEPRSVTSGTVTTVSSGTGLIGGPISSTGTLSVDVGTGANQIVQLDGSSKLPGVDGSALTNLNATRIGTRTVASSAPGVGQYLGWNNLTSQWEPMATTTGTVTNVATGTGLVGGPISSNGTLSVDVGTTANKVMQLTSGAQIPAVDGNLVTNVNAVKLQARDVSANAPTTGQVLGWNGLNANWEPMSTAVGSVTNVQTGSGLLGGSITSSGTISVDVGTAANKIMQLTSGAQIPAVDGNLVTNVNAVKLQARDVSAAAPGGGQVLAWNNTTSVWEPRSVTSGTVTTVSSGTGLIGGPISSTGTLSVDVGTGANQIVQLDGSSKLPGVDGSALTNLNATRIGTRTVASSAPGVGQYLGWNNLTSQWEPMATTTGTVTNVATGTGLVGGPISSNGTLSVDVGTTANKVMQLTSGAQIPAVDGNLVTNVNAVKLQARDVSASAPSGGQVLAWNNTTSVWEPRSVTSGTVTTVSSGTGLVGGPISSNGTLSVDVGTGANQIVQLDGSSKLPAVDGHQLSNLNAVRIGTRTVTSSAPGVGQYLGWNNLTSQWEPMATTTGTVTNVATGTGLVGGPIANVGTLSVDVGTAANKILQLTSDAQIPAVDGNLVTNVNAVKLQARDVSASAPSGGQVLAWNNTTSVWEPRSVTSGTVTTVSSGTGLVGGPISSNGTLSVDVGTGANQIVQLDGSSKLPGVDGSALTNLNATRIGTRTVASSAPGVGQYLGWNNLTSQWEPMATTTGTVTNVATGTGLVGGPISSNGTLSVDVGTTANKVMQLTSGAQIPAVDGNLVTNVNAVKLQARDVSASAPSGGQVLAWNNTTSVWEPRSVTSGTVTTVSSGTGLIGGPISSTGTLSVDVGTGANQIVQLDGSSKLPAVDGYQLTNLNASRIGTRTVATVAPGVGQYLGWNNLTSQWEPSTAVASTGTVGALQFSNGSGGFLSNNNIMVDGTNGRIGVGTVAPSFTLDVNGTVNANAIYLNGTLVNIQNIQATAPATGGTVQMIEQTATNAATNYRSVLQVRNDGTGGAYELNILGQNAGGVTTFAVAQDGSGYFAKRVGIGTVNPEAMLDVASVASGDSAIIVPRDTAANRPSTGVNGMIRFNTTTQKFEAYQGAWTDMIAAGSGNATQLQGNSVQAGVPTNGNILTWNSSGSRWEARANAAASNGIANVIQFSDGSGGFLSNSNVVIDSSGRMGIGTNNPVNKLQIEGGALHMVGNPIYFRGGMPSDTYDFIKIDSATQSTMQIAGFTGVSLGYSSPSCCGSPGALTPVITTVNANVGIGTVTPRTILEVASTTSGDSAIIIPRDTQANRPATGVNGMIRFNTTTNKLEAYQGLWQDMISVGSGSSSTGTSGAIQYSNGSGAFLSNNNIVIDATNGRLGIGTTTPGYPLTVQGNAYVGGGFTVGNGSGTTEFSVATNGVTTWPNVAANWVGAPSVGAYGFGVGTVGWLGQMPYLGDPGSSAALTYNIESANIGGTGRQYMTSGAASAFTQTTGNFYFLTWPSGTGGAWAGTPTTAAVITNSGNVGIGTSSPVTALSVAGTALIGNGGEQCNTANQKGAIRYNSGNGAFEVCRDHTVGWEPIVQGVAVAGACDSTATYSSAGTWSYVVPGSFSTITIQIWGGGGGGSSSSSGGGGSNGGTSSVSSLGLTASGGGGSPSNGGAGPGSGSGGTTNTTGGWGSTVGMNTYGGNGGAAPNGGAGGSAGSQTVAGGAGSAPGAGGGGGGSNVNYGGGGGGGSGGYVAKTFSTATLSPGVTLTDLIVGSGGAGGTGGFVNGGNGAAGRISITCSTTPGNPAPNDRGIVFYNSGNYDSSTSFVYSASGNVGIGTVSPSSKLDVQGTLWANTLMGATAIMQNPSGTAYVNINGNGADPYSNASLVLGNMNGTKKWSVHYRNANTVANWGEKLMFNYYDGSTYYDYLTFGPTGSVGINTVAPMAGLDIATTGTQSAVIVPRDTTGNRPAGVNGMIRFNSTTNKLEAYQGLWQDVISTGGGGGGSTGTSGAIQYSNGSSAFLSNNNIVIDATNGRIGIGTTTPAYQLTFRGNADQTIGMQSQTTASSNGNSLTVLAGRSGTGNDKNGGDLILAGGSATGSGSSNVYIQTVPGGQGTGGTLRSPSLFARFGGDARSTAIGPNAAATGLYAFATGDSSSASGNTSVAIGKSVTASGDYSLALGQGATVSGNYSAGIGLSSSTFTVSSNNVMAIMGGSVGIGTTTPRAILEVESTTSGLSSIILPRDTTANRPATGVNGMIRYNSTSNKFEVYQGLWMDMISSGGASSAGNNGAVQVGNGSGTFLSNNNIIIDTTNGRLGIGIAAPTAKLDLSGSNMLAGSDWAAGVGRTNSTIKGFAITVPHYTNAEESVQMITGYSGGVGQSEIYIGGGTGTYNASTEILFYTAANNTTTTGSERMRINRDGRVGIGSTTPRVILDLVTASSGESAIIVPSGTTAFRPATGVNGMIRFNSTSLKFEGYQGAWQNLISTGGSSSGNSGAIQVSNGSGVFLSNNNIVIDTSSGRLGIGTDTSPDATLEVNGGAAVNSSYEGMASYVNSSTSYPIPDTSLNIRRITMTGNATITLPAFTSPSSKIFTLTIFIKQDGTGNRTITWAGSGGDTIKWDAGTAPTISPTANKITIIQLTKPSDETYWYGSMVWKEN